DAGVDRLQGQARVEVDVRDDRDRREPDDAAQRLRVLRLRHRAADDLAAGRHECGDLTDRRLDIARRRQRHRLDDYGRAAADGDAADVDAQLGGHYDPSLPMSFERPMKKSRRTTARPTAETRS